MRCGGTEEETRRAAQQAANGWQRMAQTAVVIDLGPVFAAILHAFPNSPTRFRLQARARAIAHGLPAPRVIGVPDALLTELDRLAEECRASGVAVLAIQGAA